MDRKKIYPLYMIIIPALVFIVFFVIPSTVGYIYAFTNWSAARADAIKFIGFQNIIDVIQNRKLPIALVNTVIYAFAKTIAVTFLGFALAYILNKKLVTQTALRTVYFIPIIFSTLVVGLTFAAIFQTRNGTINGIINFFGGESIQWLGNRWTAVLAISLAEIWRNTGYTIVITLAGIQSVSTDYIEAAKIDGARELQIFRRITLPVIMPIVNVNILFSLIYGLKMFDIIYVMTKGGPGSSTESFGTLIMNEMSAGRYAQSVAVNLVFSILLVLIAAAYQRVSEKWEYAA
jgi:raffinose/stachyose/melibiose transport system permease protein